MKLCSLRRFLSQILGMKFFLLTSPLCALLQNLLCRIYLLLYSGSNVLLRAKENTKVLSDPTHCQQILLPPMLLEDRHLKVRRCKTATLTLKLQGTERKDPAIRWIYAAKSYPSTQP